MRFVVAQMKGDLDQRSLMYRCAQEAGKLFMSSAPIATYTKPKDLQKKKYNPAMSLPEYVGRRNSTTLVGRRPFGYACTDDRAGDACAF